MHLYMPSHQHTLSVSEFGADANYGLEVAPIIPQ